MTKEGLLMKQMRHDDAEARIEDLVKYPVPQDDDRDVILKDFILSTKLDAQIQAREIEIGTVIMKKAWTKKLHTMYGLDYLVDQLSLRDLVFDVNGAEYSHARLSGNRVVISDGKKNTAELRKVLSTMEIPEKSPVYYTMEDKILDLFDVTIKQKKIILHLR